MQQNTCVHTLSCTTQTDQSGNMCKLRHEIRHLSLHYIFKTWKCVVCHDYTERCLILGSKTEQAFSYWAAGRVKARKLQMSMTVVQHNPDTVKPSVSNHPKCKDLVVNYGKWLLTGVKQQRSLQRRGADSSTLWKFIYCMKFLSYNMCCSMLSLKVFCILWIAWYIRGT